MRFPVKMIAVAGVVWGMGLVASTASALPPISKEVDASKIKPTKQEPQLRNGMQLIVTLANNNKVRGTLVYASEAKDYLVLRPRPGAMPEKIPGKNIKDIIRIKPASLSRPDEGGIRPAIPGAKQPAPQDNSEIHAVEITTGPYRRVQYVAPALSPPEKKMLMNLQQAENRYTSLLLQASLINEYVMNERLEDNARRNAMDTYYMHSAHFALGFRPMSQLYPYYMGYPGYISPLVYNRYIPAFGNYTYGYPYGTGSYFGRGGYGFPNQGAGGGMQMMHNPTAGEVNSSPIKTALAVDISKNVTPESMAQAKAELEQMRSYAMYDDLGRVVAMNIWDRPAEGQPGVRPAGGEGKD